MVSSPSILSIHLFIEKQSSDPNLQVTQFIFLANAYRERKEGH